MPTFENIEVTTTAVEFEVYCGTCGAGLCNESDTRKSRSRGYLQVIVNACPECMKTKDKEIDDLKSQIEQFERDLERKEGEE